MRKSASRTLPSAYGFPASPPTPTPEPPAGYTGPHNRGRALHAEIACRAYSIWECKGRPDDSQLADWLEAEAEVQAEDGWAEPGLASVRVD